MNNITLSGFTLNLHDTFYNNYIPSGLILEGSTKNKLLNASPYISHEVMTTEAEENFNTSEHQNTDVMISAFPNPFTGKTRITYQLSGYDNANLRIYNVIGNEVYNYVINTQSGSIDVNATDWPASVYTCSITVEDTHIEKVKLVVIK